MTHWILGLAYEQTGRLAESIAALEQAVTLSGSTLMQGLLGRAYGIAGRLSDASGVLDDLSRRAENTFVSRDALRSFTQVWARRIARSICSTRHATNPHSI